jgi:hypothetical protein
MLPWELLPDMKELDHGLGAPARRARQTDAYRLMNRNMNQPNARAPTTMTAKRVSP